MRTLYLIILGGMRYGIWKDDVRSVREAPQVHRLPLSPACIAGISVLDGRSTALADLAVCIGLRPPDYSGAGRVLFVAGKEGDSAFIVPGALAEAVVPPDAVFPMPEYVRTAGIDTCVVIDSVPVPVINLAGLYAHIHEPDPAPSVPSFTAPPATRSGDPADGPVRLFTAGGELFAAPGTDMPADAVRPGRIAPVPLTPRPVRGLVYHDGSVFPVVHLAERMELPVAGSGDLLLVAELAGTRFGFLVDGDQGTFSKDQVRILLLPPVVQTAWTPAVVLHQSTVIPVLSPPALLGAAPREVFPGGIPERYSPASRFAEAFERTNVEVIEFSLLGVRHALPKSEVEDIVSFKPYRRVPDALPIVIGVTEHKGDVLPVLDLAMVFGRRSLATADWSMVLVKNGDFRAFVITEHVYDERAVPRDVQRKVPILLPHNLVYGCYPEGTVVRLILNVEALAVHFDKSLVKELLAALTREMAEAPAELVPALLPEEHLPVSSGKEEEQPLVAAAAESALMAQAEAEERERLTAADRERAEAEAKARAEAEERIRLEAEERAREESERAARLAAEERAQREAEDRLRREVEERFRTEAEERARAEAEKRAREEAAAKARREEEESARQEEARARREAEEQARRAAEEQARHAAEESARIAAEEKARREAEEQARRREEERVRLEAEEKARSEAEEEQRRTAAAVLREAEAIKKNVTEETVPAGAAAFSSGTTPRLADDAPRKPVKALKHGSPEWRKYIAYGIAAVVLSLLVYLGLPRSTGERGGEGKPHFAEAGKTAEKKPEPAGPLVLTVPADKKIEAEVYIVKQGDTLWDICERFTGDPFNYPRVAGDNRIANPDLIFPGQKIVLKQ